MELSPDLERLLKIFMPNAYRQQERVRAEGRRFVHYTNAEAALSILRSKEVWMRKSSCMNDFMEVQHGLNCLYKTYRDSDHGKTFKETLNGIFEGITGEIEALFDSWTPHLQTNTYLACVSEHESSEDTFGRLSMWRAYSESTGVGLVMNSGVFFNRSNALKAYTSPVAYLSDQEFETEFGKIAGDIAKEKELIGSQGREVIKQIVFNTLKFAVLCTKHPGFKEEKEWRVVYSPSMEMSNYLKKEIEVIGGVPQPIYKIPLQNIPEEGLTGMDIPSLLDRIIIGPSQYPLVLHEAFSDVLLELGVKEPHNRVFISDIPLRR